MPTNDVMSTWLLCAAVTYLGTVSAVAAERLSTRTARMAFAAWTALYFAGALAAGVYLAGWRVAPPVLVSAGLIALGVRRLPDYTKPGIAMMAASLQLVTVGAAWGTRFLFTMPVGPTTRTLLLSAYPVLLLALPSGALQFFEGCEVLWRRRWNRPRAAPAAESRTRWPKISVHVPAHAEPPDVVIATLDTLAALRYPNLEVLVIDNNTVDPDLWKPVQRHCKHLGPTFRFFHVEGLSGAKAGALNLALRHTAPDADLIAVVDADYHVEPDFLERLVGFFDDPSVGFVQSPHDYRGWEGSPYLRACYWEYRYFFRTILVSRNERRAALTVGTMCVIRRAALEKAGGWAEWCVTEDSELAIRIHALGYSSVYVRDTFGRGLIPETFQGYKRQRFRWTYGPVQELKRHIRLMLPPPLGRPSALRVAQRLHHLNHGLDRLVVGLPYLLLPLGFGVMASMIVHREIVAVPFELWAAVTVLAPAAVAVRLLLYRVEIGCSVRDTLWAALASKALAHTVSVASVRALFTRSTAWRRTDKFCATPSLRRAVASAQPETMLGSAHTAAAVAAVALLPRSGLLVMLSIGFALQALRLFAAPVFAFVGERDLTRRVREEMAAAGEAGYPSSHAESEEALA